ncbi:MAG TPA: TOBE domain-containing protein, partial [Verrucomicrobiota bacterium]|nr:TOBE domain-containing protein [Verrucomicrobiota bacterium]
WLPGTINANAAGTCLVATDSGQLEVHDAARFNDRQSVWVGFRPEAVQFGVSQVNQFRARVAQVTYLGELEQYVLELPGGITIKALDANPVEVRARNTEWPVYVLPRNVFLFPRSD